MIENNSQNPCITIKAFRENGKAVVTVKGNAGGIPKHIIDNIFDPYFSAETYKAGAGIGLYLSKIIIEENMNGKLTAGQNSELKYN